MAEALIQQTLHGYRQGHGLLAGGEGLTAEERALLLGLSDLSGYLPHGQRFTRYHSGFPCGRFYAFACTWPDPLAERGGTVVTHTLLVPPPLLATLPDPFALSALHQAPGLETPLSRYASRLAPHLPLGPPTRPDEGRALAALVLLFGQAERPLLFCEEQPPEDIVAFLWASLWPRARFAFSFCTLALQARQLGRTPFTFLGVPPLARGAFYELQRSPAWWDQGRLREPLAARVAQPLFLKLLHEGCAAIVERAMAEGLRTPEPAEIPLLARYQELAERSATTLTAAVARAELLFRYQPESTCSAWPAVLQELLLTLPQAPLAPRPLFYLIDFFERPQTAAFALEPGFRAGVAALLQAELPRRLVGAPGAAEALPALLRGRSAAAYAELFVEAIGVLAQEPREREAFGAARRCVVALIEDDELAPLGKRVLIDLLRRLDPSALEELIERIRSDANQGVDRVAHLARDQRWPLLLFLTLPKADGGLAALLEAGRLLAADAPVLGDSERSALAEMLRRTSLEARIFFALQALPPLAEDALAAGIAAVREFSPLPGNVLTRATAMPGGPELLCRALPERALAAALNQHPPLSREVLLLALCGVDLPVSEWLSDDIPEEDLLRVLPPAGIAPSRVAQRYLTRAVSVIFRRLLRGEMTAEEAVPWLRAPALQQHLLGARPFDLSRGAQSDHVEGGSALFSALTLALGPEASIDAAWAATFQDAVFGCLNRSQLAAALPAWCDFFALPFVAWLRQTLASSALPFIVGEKPQNGYLVVERVFSLLYQELQQGRGFKYRWMLGSPWFGWDHCKTWRHWLLDTYLEQGWPPVSLVRATVADDTLLGQILNRARKSERGRALRRSLETWAHTAERRDAEMERTLRLLAYTKGA